jgi:hypothetical protein
MAQIVRTPFTQITAILVQVGIEVKHAVIFPIAHSLMSSAQNKNTIDL